MKRTGRLPTSIVPTITAPTTSALDARSRGPKITILVHLVSWVCLGLLSTTALAQPSTPAETFGEVVDVRVINLDVVVTDGDGNRVPGLQPSDFVLRVDGEERPIDYFTEVREGRAAGGTGDTRQAPAVDVGDVVPTHYLVFFDTLFGFAFDQQSLARSMAGQLGQMGPRDRMALVVYDGNRVREVSGWSGSRTQLERSLERMSFPASAGANPYLQTRDFDASEQIRAQFEAESIGPDGVGATPFEDPPELQMYKKRIERNLDRVSRAAAATMQGYADVQGRKVMVLMSGGWPYNTVEYFRRPNFGDPPNNSRALEKLQRIADTANLLGYTLYVADVPRSPPPFGQVDDQREYMLHATLDHLADETGGRALKNRTSLDVLARAAEDTRSYYWMGFTSPGEADDKRHNIKLEVRRPGLEVRTRRGYVDVSRTTQVNELVESAALVGNLPNAKPLVLRFGPPKGRGRRVEVPVALTVPLDALTMVPTAQGHHARLELRISAIDENGYLNKMPVIPWEFSGPAPAPGQVVVYETSLKLRKLGHTVVVALYDLNSGTLLSGERRLAF